MQGLEGSMAPQIRTITSPDKKTMSKEGCWGELLVGWYQHSQERTVESVFKSFQALC